MSYPQLPQLTNQEIITAPGTSLSIHSGLAGSDSRRGSPDQNCKRECRVCLEETDNNGNPLMSTCLCTGSLKYVHRVCLQDWLLRKYEESEDKAAFRFKNYLSCEICHSPYLIDFSLDLAWTDCSTFAAKIRANKGIAAINIIFVVVDIICLVLSCSYALEDSRKQEYNIKEPKYFLVYVAILLAFICSLYGVYQFIRVFMMDEKIVVRSGEGHPEGEKKIVYQVQSSIKDKEVGKSSEVEARA